MFGGGHVFGGAKVENQLEFPSFWLNPPVFSAAHVVWVFFLYIVVSLALF